MSLLMMTAWALLEQEAEAKVATGCHNLLPYFGNSYAVLMCAIKFARSVKPISHSIESDCYGN